MATPFIGAIQRLPWPNRQRFPGGARQPSGGLIHYPSLTSEKRPLQSPSGAIPARARVPKGSRRRWEVRFRRPRPASGGGPPDRWTRAYRKGAGTPVAVPDPIADFEPSPKARTVLHTSFKKPRLANPNRASGSIGVNTSKNLPSPPWLARMADGDNRPASLGIPLTPLASPKTSICGPRASLPSPSFLSPKGKQPLDPSPARPPRDGTPAVSSLGTCRLGERRLFSIGLRRTRGPVRSRYPQPQGNLATGRNPTAVPGHVTLLPYRTRFVGRTESPRFGPQAALANRTFGGGNLVLNCRPQVTALPRRAGSLTYQSQNPTRADGGAPADRTYRRLSSGQQTQTITRFFRNRDSEK